MHTIAVHARAIALIACRRCGTKSQPGDSFCRKCGHSLPLEFDSGTRPHSEGRHGGIFERSGSQNSGIRETLVSLIHSRNTEEAEGKATIPKDSLSRPKSEQPPNAAIAERMKAEIDASSVTTTNDQDAAKLKKVVQRIQELEGEVAGLRDQL